MTEEMSMLRTLVMHHLDPSQCKLDEDQVSYWIKELQAIKEMIFISMYQEMLGTIDVGLVERHIKQVQHDCTYLKDVLYKYQKVPLAFAELYAAAEDCIEELMDHIENRYAGFFNWSKDKEMSKQAEKGTLRIRVLFSVDALAYFFKLLNKAGGLDAGPVTQLIDALARNFITPGVGNGFISTNSLTTKYKQVVYSTAQNVRNLLVKMLKLLDEEFG